jgi:hypothetical protein
MVCSHRHCGPRLSPEAAEKLKNHFVQVQCSPLVPLLYTS